MNDYVVREKRFSVEPFGRVEIYDPAYGMPGKMDREDGCAFCTLPTSNREAGVLLREVQGTFDFGCEEVPYTTLEVKFFSYLRDVDLAGKAIEAECEGRLLPSSIEESRELCSDSTRFVIRVDGNEMEAHTSTGGTYGRMAKYRDDYAWYFGFFLDAELTDWDMLEQKIRLLFRIREEMLKSA